MLTSALRLLLQSVVDLQVDLQGGVVPLIHSSSSQGILPAPAGLCHSAFTHLFRISAAAQVASPVKRERTVPPTAVTL